MGWVKSKPGDFGEVTTIIGLVINFLAFGAPFVSFRDTLSYMYPFQHHQITTKTFSSVKAYFECVRGLPCCSSRRGRWEQLATLVKRIRKKTKKLKFNSRRGGEQLATLMSTLSKVTNCISCKERRSSRSAIGDPFHLSPHYCVQQDQWKNKQISNTLPLSLTEAPLLSIL